MPLTFLTSFLGDNSGILFVGFLLFCFIYVLSMFFSGPKPGKNPFSAKHVRPPPEKIVTDHKARDKVLKQRFKREKVPENLDAIIIGSGIGGLSTAVMLGRAGHKVLVLEQHDQAGGCCHSFTDKGYEFDTGIHYVGNMKEGDDTRVLIDQITEGQVIWAPMDREYDKVAIGPPSKARRYCMKSGTEEQFVANLEKQFPTEKLAIAKLMQLLKEARESFIGVIISKVLPLYMVKLLIKTGLFHLIFRKFTKFSRMSVKEAFDSISDNKEFKAFLCYGFGDLGVAPSELSIHVYAGLILHFIPGAFYPLGGTSEIAFQIIPVIERYGGRVMVDAPVRNIIVDESGKAVGVTVERSSGDVHVFAKRIISGAGVKKTFNYLLPEEYAKKNPLIPVMEKVGSSLSFMSIFVGMNGSSAELGINAGNTWAFTSGNIEEDMRKYFSMTAEEVADSECPLMFISFPSAKDPNWEQKYPGKSVALLITLTPRSWFSKWKQGRVKHRGEDYEALKQKIGLQMWKQTEKLFPKLAGKLDYLDVGTPLSNKYYLGQPEGEIYGLDHGKTRFLPEMSMHLRPESGIPGLYLTGQDILTAGFSGSLKSGVLTASVILHRNLFNDLKTLIKDIKQTAKDKKMQ